MAFSGSGEAYDRFMGRFSGPLSPLFADFAGVESGQAVVDVGCGPGALTGELVDRIGAEHVAAADPTEAFVAACRDRFPGVEVAHAPAEELPFGDDRFDAALTQLVVPFMSDASAGVRELVRVTRSGGVVAACMWLSGPEMELLDIVTGAAETVAPDDGTRVAPRRYRTDAEGVELFRGTGLEQLETAVLEVTAGYAGFDELWQSVLGRSGPIIAVLDALDDAGIERFREAVRVRAGDPKGAFRLTGRAWAVRGRVAA